MKITFLQAKNTLNTITPVKGGQITKSDLAKAKGDTGVHVYTIKHDVKDAFRAQFDKDSDIREQASECQDDKEKLSSLESEFAELNKTEEEVKLSKGKLKLSEVKDYLDSTELEVLEWCIDFKK